MPERSFDDCKDFGLVRFPLPAEHPLLDDEDALEAALLQDALGSIDTDKLVPTKPIEGFLKGFRDSASRFLQEGASRLFPQEPDFALQEKDVREPDGQVSEREMNASQGRVSDVLESNQPDAQKGNDAPKETR